MSVVLPEPVVPTMPTMSPGSIVRLMSLSVFLVRSNEKFTFLNSILPSTLSSFSPLPSGTSGSASRMSKTRSTAASACWYESFR